MSAVRKPASGDVEVYIADGNNNRIRRVDKGGTISTVVGTGMAGACGNGGAATATMLSSPRGISAVLNTTSGSVILFITSNARHQVCRVHVGGLASTVAGVESNGFSGDGGAAAAAAIAFPYGVSALYNASSGGTTVYIADTRNNRIRRVDEDGKIATVAGSGPASFGGDGGAGVAASLSKPRSVSAVFNASSGGVVLYFADTWNHRVRRVDEAGIITTVAGNGTNGYSGDGGAATAAAISSPNHVAAVIDPTCNGIKLYFASPEHCHVRRVDEGGIITTVAGNGTAGFSGDGGEATAAMLRNPRGVCAVFNASSGGMVLYIADRDNNRIRRVDEGGIISNVAGNGAPGYGGDGGPASAATVHSPRSVSGLYNASSGGVVLFITDTNNHRIRRVDEGGVISTLAGSGANSFSGDGGPATAAALWTPIDVAAVVNPASGGVLVYFSDTANQRIRRVDEAGVITTVAGTGEARFDGDGGPATAAALRTPNGVCAVYNPSSGGVVLYIA
ncbi:hypothetical protein EON62_03820, partial [archaeon]